jgi:hypothetical protein
MEIDALEYENTVTSTDIVTDCNNIKPMSFFFRLSGKTSRFMRFFLALLIHTVPNNVYLVIAVSI